MIYPAMVLRSLGICALVAAVPTGSAMGSGSPEPAAPRFAFSTTAASADAAATLRVVEMPRLGQQEIRLYLAPASAAASVRSRLDSRLTFIGSVQASRRARLAFQVPIQSGRYVLGYWCRTCVPRGRSIRFQSSATLRVLALPSEECPATAPNGIAPMGVATSSPGFRWHGNGGLWAHLRADGLLVANELGGYKMLWAARPGFSAPLRVDYRPLHSSSASTLARTGVLSGYERPNATMSQMSLFAGCWVFTGRARDFSLSFIARVVLRES